MVSFYIIQGLCREKPTQDTDRGKYLMATFTLYLCVNFPEEQHQTVAMLFQHWFRVNHHKAEIKYRPLNDGHIVNHREVIIKASKPSLRKFQDWIAVFPTQQDSFGSHVVENPHRQPKAEIELEPDYASKFGVADVSIGPNYDRSKNDDV
jgi:hypothetical protein